MCIKGKTNESKPCACDESETHGKEDELVSWFQGLEAKEERLHENEDFADEERKGYADFHGCFVCDRIRRIRSFSSRKMNSKAEISGVARDCSVQKYTFFYWFERESPASYSVMFCFCSRFFLAS